MKIAVLIPCYNEALTIEKVVHGVKKEVPEADIYVFDNNSKDGTADIAKKAGALVYSENRQGKGNVVRTMFRLIEADVYVMIDGDDTYPIEEIQKLIQPIAENEADMCIGDRLTKGDYDAENTRKFHSFGNWLVKNLINKLFSADLKDIMSGYRSFSKSFIKNTPILSDGFEIETEITLFSLHHKLRIVEVPISFRERPEGSVSKLNTITDGAKVILTIFKLYKDYKPLSLFTTVSTLIMVFGIVIGIPVIVEFIETGLVPKFPSAILATGCMILSAIGFTIGVILDTITKNQRQQFEILHKNFSDKPIIPPRLN